jgi:hypothetical protein
LLHALPIEAVRSTLQGAVQHLSDGGRFTADQLDALEASSGIQNAKHFRVLYTALSIVLRAGIRQRRKKTANAEDMKRLHFPAPCVKMLIEAFAANRGLLEEAVRHDRVRFPSIADFSWRIDVTISTCALSRVLRPSVLCRMTLTNGSIRTFEMSVEQFHQLRYKVARALKHTRGLEKRGVIALVSSLQEGMLRHL